MDDYEWEVEDIFQPTRTNLHVERDGCSLRESRSIPNPVVLIDIREQKPLPLLDNHPNWIAGEKRMTLQTGAYTVEGMEQILALALKDVSELGSCIEENRRSFLDECECLAEYRWKAILIQATYEDIKCGATTAHPNAVVGTLDAIEAKHGIPVLYTSTVESLATERAASWLSKHFTYYWLEENGHDRILVDYDGL